MTWGKFPGPVQTVAAVPCTMCHSSRADEQVQESPDQGTRGFYTETMKD